MIFIITLFFILQTYSFTPQNYFTNPSFEEQDGTNENKAKGWTNYGSGCKRVRGGRTGQWCGYCKDSGTGDASIIQKVPQGTIAGGLKYNISAWVKMKNIQNGDWMFAVEGCGYSCGVYPTHKNNAACKDGTCDDDWYLISSGQSAMVFNDCNYQATLYIREKGTGEFWVDDVSFVPIVENYLYSAEVVSWRQEVFEREVEVRIATNLLYTAFQDGKYSMYRMDVFDESEKLVQTSRQFNVWYHYEQIVVSMQLKPKDLKPGYYKVRVAFYNTVTENLETVETSFRKLEKERTVQDYKIFVDVDNRCFVNGELFFPLGAYVNEYNDYNIGNFTDSPFNLMVSNAQANKYWLDRIYEKSNGKVRVINGFGASTQQKSVDKSIEYTKQKIAEWKDSPGLFGYYIADEPGLYRLEQMKATTKTVRENDISHITWSAVNQRFQLGKLKEGFDTVGIDCYPVQTFDDLQAIWVMTKQGRQRMGNTRAMWNIPQIFDWTVYNASYKLDWSKEKPPTEDQLVNMVYQWIAAGGMGIMYYDYSEVVIMHYKNNYYTEWEKIKKVTDELKRKYAPIILSNIPINPGYNLPVAKGLDYTNYVATRQFRFEGVDYFLIVNVRNVNNYVYSFTKPEGASMAIMHGKSKVTFNGTKVTCTMPGMDVLWMKGTGDNWKPDESEYSKPNLKSKFNSQTAITNEHLGQFPDLPGTNKKSSGMKLHIIVALVCVMIFFI